MSVSSPFPCFCLIAGCFNIGNPPAETLLCHGAEFCPGNIQVALPDSRNSGIMYGERIRCLSVTPAGTVLIGFQNNIRMSDFICGGFPLLSLVRSDIHAPHLSDVRYIFLFIYELRI